MGPAAAQGVMGGRSFHPQHPSNPFLNQQHHLQQQHPAYPPNNLQQHFAPSSGIGLASHAAQAGFNNVMMAQAAHEAAGAPGAASKMADGGLVRQVWKQNLEQEIAELRKLVNDYPYISMDTEFPGVVARPIGDFKSKASYHYQTVRCNVDLLKVIQLGMTLWTKEGDTVPQEQRHGYPPNLTVTPCTWTFNFKFSTEDDMYNEDSIKILKQAGVDLARHAEDGINPDAFASLLMTSGLVIDADVYWLSFHGGYDFAYLMKLMWKQMLPKDEMEFNKLIKLYFPNILDVKYLLRQAQHPSRRSSLSPQANNILTSLGQKSGLQDLADELGVQRVGTQHTAGSDAHITGLVFWAMREKIFGGQVPDDMNGHMWGLTGVGAPASQAVQNAVIAAQGHVASNANGNPGYSGQGQQQNGPSTPTTANAGLAGTSGFSGTPGPQGQGLGAITPGGGGVFGNFQYGGNR